MYCINAESFLFLNRLMVLGRSHTDIPGITFISHYHKQISQENMTVQPVRVVDGLGAMQCVLRFLCYLY